jgi:hypothetical protein
MTIFIDAPDLIVNDTLTTKRNLITIGSNQLSNFTTAIWTFRSSSSDRRLNFYNFAAIATTASLILYDGANVSAPVINIKYVLNEHDWTICIYLILQSNIFIDKC